MESAFFSGLKNLFATLFSVALAYFAPIQEKVFVIFFLFLANCIVGMLAGFVASGERFSLRKFAKCISESVAFYFLVVCLFVVGRHMDNMEGAMQVIGGVIYAIFYFYSVNVLRNLVAIFPTSLTLKFFYYTMSFEFVKRIPMLQRFQEQQRKQRNQSHEND